MQPRIIKPLMVVLKPTPMPFCFPPSPELYLTSSILLETACTFCLSNVKYNKLWYIPIYAGYGVSFYLFPKCLDKYTLNMAYTIWSGVGILFTFLLDVLLKRDVFTIKKLCGMFIVIHGIYLMK
jgi:small multidrug resistance pump